MPMTLWCGEEEMLAIVCNVINDQSIKVCYIKSVWCRKITY